MKPTRFFSVTLFVVLAVVLIAPPQVVHADVTTTGDIDTHYWLLYSPFQFWTYIVGKSSPGTLRIDGGSDFINDGSAHLGYYSTATGTVVVTGNGSTWDIDENLVVGYEGDGELSVLAGAYVHTRRDSSIGVRYGSEGWVQVSGEGSTWETDGDMTLGFSGKGTIAIEEQGKVTCGWVELGWEYDQTSEISVDGPGTQFLNRGISVGCLGSGKLSITRGGYVYSDSTRCRVGYGKTYETSCSSIATIDGPGSKWECEGPMSVGYDGFGTIEITNQGSLSNTDAHIGEQLDAVGEVSLSGGSEWVSDGELYVGEYGKGTITISGGSSFTNTLPAFLGRWGDSEGSITVSGPGSSWTCHDEVQIGVLSHGTLLIEKGATVNTGGAGKIGYWTDGHGLVTVDGPTSTWHVGNIITVGGRGNGNLMIANGGKVYSDSSTDMTQIGGNAGCSAIVTVDGPNSLWQDKGIIALGGSGGGVLNITHGGKVLCDSSLTGYSFDTDGTPSVVSVVGNGSALVHTGSFILGFYGTIPARANIAGGGSIVASEATVDATTWLTVDVDSSLTVENDGTFTNNGTVRILAGAKPTATQAYKPILATNWASSGAYQTFGGTWNEITHEFTASEVVSGVAGIAKSIDVSQEQRLLIVDQSNGKSLGASFDPTSTTSGGSSTLAFTATATSTLIQDKLVTLLGEDEFLLECWNVSSNLASGQLAFLSMEIGSGWDDLAAWYYDGTKWAEYTLPENSVLSQDGIYANFLVSGNQNYALTGVAVPEPSTLALLLTMAVGGVALWRRR